MDRVVLYSETLSPAAIAAALPKHEIVAVASSGELCRAIVEHRDVIAVIVEKVEIDGGLERLLLSLKKSFPILRVCLIAESLPEDLPAGYSAITRGKTVEQTSQEVRGFISSITLIDRRDHPRYDWPLQGLLSLKEDDWQKYNLWALSADGAFLECSTSPPTAGSRGTLRISFQNSQMATRCQVMDPRQASSNLPTGFAVHFTGLNAESMKLLNRIVQDALLQTLLQPEKEPVIPTLGEQDLSISGFEAF